MKRSVALVALLVLVASWLICVADVAARSGGGGFRSGGRARSEDEQRSYRSSESDAPDMAVPDDSPPPAKKPKKPQSWQSMVRGILTGGLIGSIFFGRKLGGFGLLEVVVLSGLIAMAFWGLSRYQTEPESHYAHAGAYGGTATLGGSTGPRAADARDGPPRAPDAPGVELSAAETVSVAEAAGDAFRQVQAAWTARDIGRAADVLTVELRAQLERECARLRASRRINHVERITLRQVAVVGSRQSAGWDCVTVNIIATLVDYTTDEVGLKVLDGNPFDPVPFQERWEMTRPSSSALPWRVNAIQ